MTICSSAFAALGHAQAATLGCPDLPIAVIPHPFGSRTRSEVRTLAGQCVQDIIGLVCKPHSGARIDGCQADTPPTAPPEIEVPEEMDDIQRIVRELRWGDGLPVIPPTRERVARMLAGTHRTAEDVVATLPPKSGEATVLRIAINAVLAGCSPAHLPILIAAVEAVSMPQFNLQAVQATTNPVTTWLIVNGPMARELDINSGMNCLGPGTWANATLGRALRLVLQNIGGAIPGDLDRATQGQPGKFTLCCAENEIANPWQALHVERGFAATCSTVTVAAATGTLNLNTHARDSDDLLRVIADAMAHAPCNDYRIGGEPWIVLCPEHAAVLHGAGLTKTDVKNRLWELSKLAAHRMAAKDLERTRHNRQDELGTLGPDSMVPISATPDLIGILVAGGAGTHSVYLPGYGSIRSVTRAVD